MRVVVFGATGNIGTSTLLRLAGRDEIDEIVAVARRAPARSFSDTRFIGADVARDELTAVVSGADAVVHLAWRLQPARRREALEATNVRGSERVFRAVAEAGVPALVYASSVGAYSPGPLLRRVDESHPTAGVDSVLYSRQKARVERILDRFEDEMPGVRVVRIRPALAFKKEAAWGIRRLFLGPFLPTFLLRDRFLQLVPYEPRLRAQAVHSLDVGDAFARAVVSDARGPFNVAAEPILDGGRIARLLGARPVDVPGSLLRSGLAAAYHLRLAPLEPGWFDLGVRAPLMRTDRARAELGWRPTASAEDAFLALLEGLREGAALDTPPLRPQRSRALADLLGIGDRRREGPAAA